MMSITRLISKILIILNRFNHNIDIRNKEADTIL